MWSEIKEFKKYPVPTKSAWDKKSYDPIKWLYHLKNKEKEYPEWLEKYFFDPYFNLKNWLINFFSFFKKLYVWIPIIWKDRDYDDYYIFEILKQKILQQRNYLVRNNRHTNIPQDNHWMTVCLNLIERIQKSYYEIEYFEYQDSKHNFVEITEENESDYHEIISNSESKKLYRLETEYIYDNRVDFINKYPLDRNKAINYLKKYRNCDVSDYAENEESRSSICVVMSTMRHQKAIKILFLILTQKIEAWWD